MSKVQEAIQECLHEIVESVESPDHIRFAAKQASAMLEEIGELALSSISCGSEIQNVNRELVSAQRIFVDCYIDITKELERATFFNRKRTIKYCREALTNMYNKIPVVKQGSSD